MVLSHGPGDFGDLQASVLLDMPADHDLAAGGYFLRRKKCRSKPSASTMPRYSCPTFFAQVGMSLREPASPDWTSTTWPTRTAPMAFLASSSGPGQAVPRASTVLSAVRVFRSIAVVMVT